MEEAPHLSSSGRTGKKKEKKSNVRVRERVGSPTSARHGPIEVNMHGGTFLLL